MYKNKVLHEPHGLIVRH